MEGNASGQISSTTVSGSFAAGIKADRRGNPKVSLDRVTVFDNNPDLEGVRR
jgi:hypothetical protein